MTQPSPPSGRSPMPPMLPHSPTQADGSPFHEGEQRLQSLTGRREKMETWGRAVIRDHMPDQHRSFFAQLPFIVVGGMDRQRQPWATLWAGPPGFLHSPQATVLQVERPHQCHGDPLSAHWGSGSPIGLLGIEPHTRRRNRLNGTLSRFDEQRDGPGGSRGGARGNEAPWRIHVRQSFGNCPKYIQPRLLNWHEPAASASMKAKVRQGAREMPQAARDLVGRADTFFIASASPGAGLAQAAQAEGIDVSHRGGEAGFVRMDDAQTLIVPDYSGNFTFNTLGNILLQPRIGLLFIDFERGDMLWLAAHGQVDLDSPRIADYPGAQRLLRVSVDEWIHSPAALPLRVKAV